MKYLATLMVLSFFSCSGQPAMKGYYPTYIKDTAKYIGRMHYFDNFKHDTSFADTVLVIHNAKDSVIFWLSDFYLRVTPYLFEYKRVYADFKINNTNLYEISDSGRLTTWNFTIRFYDTDKLRLSQKKTAKHSGVIERMQKYRFEGDRYFPKR